MTRDLNRKISKIGYNSLNLPETITYTDGHKVMNTYDCLGRKVSVIYQVSVPSVTTPQADGSSVTSYSYRTYMRRSYSGNCIYRNDTLERILTTTGYITPRENIQPRDINLPPNANSVRGFESKGNSIVPIILYNEIKTKLKGVGLEIYKR